MTYYRIISSEVPVELQRTATNDLIQLSDKCLTGFRPVIEDECLPEKEGYYVASSYEIINGEVHKTYHYEEIVEQELEEI